MSEIRYEWDTKEGKYLPATGRPGANTIVWTGYEWIPGEPNPEGPGAFSRGLSTGFESLKGFTTEVAPAIVQSALGFDEAAQANLQQYRERMEKLQAEGRGTRVGLKDISDFSSALSFVGETLGETVTNLLPVGGLAAAGAKVAAKTAVANLAKGRVAAKAAQITAQNPGKYTAMEAGDIAAKAVATELGIAAGAGLGSFALNVPETFQNIYTETGEMRPGLATAIGTVKAALDTYAPVSLINKVRGAEFADRLSTNITAQLFKDRPGAAGAVSGLLSAAAKEGLTEGTQQFLDEATVSALKDSSIDWEKIAESALKGAIGGGAMGAPAGYLQGRREAAAIAQRQVGEQAQAEAQTQAQLYADQFTQLGATTPAQAPRTDEEIRANIYNTVAAAYPGIRISPEGQISTQDVRREAIARVQRGEAKSVTEEERRLKKEIGQRLSVAVGEAETRARMQAVGMLPQEEPGTTAAMREGLRQQELQRLRSLASEDIEGLPPVYQKEILEARRRLQEEEAGEAQIQGLTEGFPPRPEPLLLPPPQTYEVPGQPPLTRDQLYQLADAQILRGREDLIPLRDDLGPLLSRVDEAVKGGQRNLRPLQDRLRTEVEQRGPNFRFPDVDRNAQQLAAAITNPDLTQARIRGEGVDILTAGPAGTQEQFRQTPQEFIDQVYKAKDNQPLAAKYPKDPAKESPLEAAARYAYELPVGARLNQTGIRNRFKQLGLPLKDIPKIEKAVRTAHPTLFEKGIKVASRDRRGPEIFKTVGTSKPPTVVEVLPPERPTPPPAVRREPVILEGEYVEDLDTWVDTNTKPNNLGILQLPAPQIDEAIARGELTPSDVQDIQESGIEIVDPTKINVGDFVTLGTDQGTVISIRDGKARVAPNPNVPQFYWEVPVSSLRKAPITALAGIKEIKGKSSIDVARMIQNFGAGRYVGEPADVTIKELVQNSLDAVKEALYKNKISEGKIDVIVDPDTRKITVSDNGVGMSPEVLIRAFFTLFGSKKDIPVGLRSGGYGLAKIYMFTMGEKLELTTVDTNGVQSSVNLDTGAILSSISGKPFKITQQQTDKPSGTTVSITLKPTHIDPFTNKEKSTSIPTSIYGYPALYRPILPVDQSGKLFPISVNFDSGFGLNKISIGQDYLTKNKLDKAFTVESDAWDADVYIGKISEFPQHQFLSSGVLQFGKTISTALGPVKNDVIVNFRPKVDAIDPRYPINDTRENFKEHAGNNIKALNQIFSRIQSAQQVEDLGRLFSNTFTLPTINIFEKASQGALSPLPRSAVTKLETKIPSIVRVEDGKLLDTDNNPISFLDSDKISSAITDVPTNTPLFHNNVTISEKDLQPVVPLMAELSSVFRTLRDAVANFKAFKDYPVADNYVGISLDKNYLGIKIKAPFEAVFVNPFLSFSDPELKNNLNPKVRATLILNTMIHELSHIRNMGHDADFIGDTARVEAFLQSVAVLDPARDAIVESLVRHGDAYAKVWSQFNSDAVTDLRSGLEGSKLSSLRGPTTLPEGQLGNAHSAIQGGEKRRGSSYIRAAAQSGQGVQIPGGTGTINIPSGTPTELQGRVMRFAAESQQRSDALDSLDKPYTCRI